MLNKEMMSIESEFVVYGCGCTAKGDNIAGNCPIHGDKIVNHSGTLNRGEETRIREITLENPYIMSGITGHFENDEYMMVEKVRFDKNKVGFYGKMYQINSEGEADFRGRVWINFRLRSGNVTKY